MSSNKRFYIQFSSLLILIVISIVILYKIPTSEIKKDSSFLVALHDIEGNLDEIKFLKKVKKVEVVVVSEKVIKPVKEKVVLQKKKRSKLNSEIKPASESVININSSVAKSSKFSKIEKKFGKTHDFRLALKLSKLYFKKKRYKQSLKWSMIANELNDKDENSWIMFAKSKVKLGDKKSAKSALLTYNRVYKSKRVKRLLNGISS